MADKFPLATSSWDQDELSAINRVIANGSFTMGEEVAKFEEEFSKYFGTRFSVMVNSGSSANLLMTAALFFTTNNEINFSVGDEIIVPAVSWSTTYYPLHQYGLRLKFVDIDINTLNYDLEALREAVTDNTRAIMLVNLLGNPNEFDIIRKIIGTRNIVLLEDNCESMGARYKEAYTGSLGIIGTYSTFFSHHISTMEGGVIVTNDEELYHIILSLRAHGWTRQLPKQNKLSSGSREDNFYDLFNFVLPGYNVRPLELSGAIGREQIKKLPSIVGGRRSNAKYFQELFADHPLVMIQKEIQESSWFGFSLIIRDEKLFTRSNLILKLKENGFEHRPVVAGNFTKNPVMKYINGIIHSDLKNADIVDRNGLFIGNHHYPINETLERLYGILEKV